MREPRAAVMIVVEATWEDHGGTLRTIDARMENKSASGACVRIETPMPVGSKLNIRSHREQFAGSAKYCLSEGREYLVGIEREPPRTAPRDRPAVLPLKQLRSARSAAPIAKGPRANGKASRSRTVPPARANLANTPDAEDATAAIVAPVIKTDDVRREPGNSPPGNFAASLETALQVNQHSPQPLTEEEKRIMRRKWLESALWSNKQDGDRESSNGNGESNGKCNRDSQSTNGDHILQLAPLPARSCVESDGEGILKSHVEYLTMEDIYLAGGIVSLRRGYSINKVVEMLRSEHMRGLSKEMKRAAVLMALDAAGIGVAA